MNDLVLVQVVQSHTSLFDNTSSPLLAELAVNFKIFPQITSCHKLLDYIETRTVLINIENPHYVWVISLKQDAQLVFRLACKHWQSKFSLAQNFESKDRIWFTLPHCFFQLTFIYLTVSSRANQFPEIVLFPEVCNSFSNKLLCRTLFLHHCCEITGRLLGIS